MRKPSKNVARTEYNRVEKLANVAQLAIYLIMNDKPDATERIKIDDDRYTLALYGRNRCDGGIVVVSFHYPGQRDQVRVNWFDAEMQDWRERIGTSPVCTAFAIACERLNQTTQKLSA